MLVLLELKGLKLNFSTTKNLLLDFFRYLRLGQSLERCVKPQMFLHSQATEQHIVLWADSEALPNQIDIRSDVESIDNGSTRGRGKQAGQNRHCSGFTSTIVTEK